MHFLPNFVILSLLLGTFNLLALARPVETPTARADGGPLGDTLDDALAIIPEASVNVQLYQKTVLGVKVNADGSSVPRDLSN
ncbi:hypothetical protein CVT24_003661 [Panaeolus cyanescens]|uniref:Uncharacterized protein n=1 Tax=Panaeolus cyanescens TaxID=181874 RepID=A0A409W8K5_9AGAR|nr:hypothetical protein CVT24_003661 [Panaeolus cyanescens]